MTEDDGRATVLAVIGVVVLVGLLIAARNFPEHADLLRMGALIWFFCIGVILAALPRRRRRSYRRRDTDLRSTRRPFS